MKPKMRALGRRVALKFLPENMARNPRTRQRFEREARAASSLNHPNICTIYEVEEHNQQPVIVMELLEGESLKERIRKGTVPTEELVDCGIQISDALAPAHAKGIVHRDIKPGNLFIVGGERVKVLDFGLGKVMPGHPPENEADEETLTMEGVIPGTTAYMSPEQIRGEEADSRSDLFSLGVVLYEMATGKRPFAGKNRILERLLEKDRERRYQSAKEIRSGLALNALTGLQSLSMAKRIIRCTDYWNPPELIYAPTGSGKSDVITVWLTAVLNHGPAVREQSKRARTLRMIRTLRTLGYRVEPLRNPA
jgi:serine/threonine protein kinase